jgi:hypothetical protein
MAPDVKQITVAEALAQLEGDFWQGKVRTSAAKRTWTRITDEVKRLPQQANLTTDLLVAVASTTKAGSRTRLESCKVFKRLGKLAGLDDLDRLDAVRTPYEPKERELPDDATLMALLEKVNNHSRYGWMTWDLAVVSHHVGQQSSSLSRC